MEVPDNSLAENTPFGDSINISNGNSKSGKFSISPQSKPLPVPIDRETLLKESPKIMVNSPPKSNQVKAPSLFSISSNQTIPSQTTKSLPANPLTTKHDVDSTHNINSSSSSINDQSNEPIPSTPVQQSSGFFNNMMTSFSFNSKENNVNSEGDVTIGLEDANSTATSKDSPSIISYRRDKKTKGRRGTSSGSVDLGLSPLNEDAKPYTPKTPKVEEGQSPSTEYADEYFKSTNYRYASDTRNENFHNLFKSVPSTERLLEDFSCALNRDILLQGRLYISEHNICFNSNLLGWVTNLIIPFYDILNFEKTATAGLFQNGIAINLKNNNGKHSFATFLSRDLTYNMFQDVWTAANDENPNIDSKKNDTNNTTGGAVLSKGLSLANEDLIEEYDHALMEIDGNSPVEKNYSASVNEIDDDEDEDEDEDDDDDDTYDDDDESDNSDKSETKLKSQKIYKFKKDSKYKFDGPFAHGLTNSKFNFKSETILATENFNCSPGMLFEILFGDQNDIIIDLLTSQDGKDFSKFSEYSKNENNLKERSYSYEKGLNYGVGPKSTTCNVKETIEHFDLNNYINVVNTTQTPNVPSGGAFQVKTRYIFTWSEQNTTSLVISFWVDWIGTSWMKGVIERSCKSGQEAATKALLQLIKESLKENVIESTEEVKVSSAIESVEEPVKEQVISEDKTENLIYGLTLFQILVVGLLFSVVLLQLLIVFLITGISEKTSNLNFMSLSSKTEDLLFKGEEILIWNWIDERLGRLDGNEQSKTNQLKEEIDSLINKWTQGELNSPEGELLIKRFENDLNQYTSNLKSTEREKKSRADALRRSIQALL